MSNLTREESKQRVAFAGGNGQIEDKHNFILIDEIFDYVEELEAKLEAYENRSCSGCKYYSMYGECTIRNMNSIGRSKDWYCDDWQAKEGE